MVFITIVLTLVVVVLIYLSLTWNFDYWKKLGVNGPKPQLLVGNCPGIFIRKRHMIYDLDEIYRKFKRTNDFVGIYGGRTPQLFITSPALARRIFVTDFKHFSANTASLFSNYESECILANNPFCLTGKKWEENREELTTGLTINRVQNMYSVTNRICKKMTYYIKERTKIAPMDGLNAKDISLRFSSEVVTECIFGVNADSFGRRPTPILGMITTIFDNSFTTLIYFVMVWLFPTMQRFIKFRFVTKHTEDFFNYLMQNGIDFSKSQKHEKQYDCNYLDDMFELQKRKNLSTWQLTATSMTFMLKGSESVAGVLAHCLLMLARNPSYQEKVRSEFVRHIDENGAIAFKSLVKLPLLDACIHEAIRIFPPAFIANKLCTESITLTNKNGHTLNVRNGQQVILSLYSLMMDEDFYPNPQEFRPERFLNENGGVQKYVESGVYFGFGDGPRSCLGMHFALAQSKAAIVEILRNFNVRVSPKTRKDNIWNPKTYQTMLDGGIWLNFEVRNI